MIRLNRYKRLDNGMYFKDIRILYKCKTVDATFNFVMNKFNKIAE